MHEVAERDHGLDPEASIKAWIYNCDIDVNHIRRVVVLLKTYIQIKRA